jgi:hypothetical protein
MKGASWKREATACQWHEDSRKEAAEQVLRWLLTLAEVAIARRNLRPLEGGPWGDSISASPCTAYLPELGNTAVGKGGRNSSILSPNTGGACRGEEVVDDAAAVELVSFIAHP